jgi:hypothetical protein
VLNEVSREGEKAISQKQEQLKGQLEQLQDNRMQRYFQSQSGSETAGGKVANAEPVERVQLQIPDQQRPGDSTGTTTGRTATTGAGRGGRGTQPAGPATASQQDTYALDAATGRNVNLNLPAEGTSALKQSNLYIPENVYSLPVSLPAGEIQLDFVRSSGAAELSIWAMPVVAIRNLYSTAAIVGVLALILGIVKAWPKYNFKKPIKTRRIITYVLLFIVLFILLGLTGLIVSFCVILLSEIGRLIFA